MRAAVDLAVIREPAQARDGEPQRLRQRVDVVELGELVLFAARLAIKGEASTRLYARFAVA